MPYYMAHMTISDTEANLLEGEQVAVIVERVNLTQWIDYMAGKRPDSPSGDVWNQTTQKWVAGGPGTALPMVRAQLVNGWSSWRGVYEFPGIRSNEVIVAQFIHPRLGVMGAGDPMIKVKAEASTVLLQLT
jgi:hypothetical protein